MKVKEIKRTANVAWSPRQQYPIYLAAGTAAQQLDATFSTTSALELYHVDLTSKDLDMPVAASMPIEHRFYKLIWTDCGINSNEHPSGIICGGTDSGEVCILDAAAILAGNHEDAVLHSLKDHSGPVQTLDINKHQNNLLATGASDSEIFIWDLNKPVSGLTPGPKTSPSEQVNSLAWNNQVQHILASSSQMGRVVVWDLRKSEPIIKVGDQSAMFHYKSMAWHPDVATQLLIGNEDDRYPVIQMWDLRFATSPMKVFEGHTRGVLSLAWCPQDTDLLMSCGKDNRILCWNPNTQLPNGEIIYELPTTAQWSSDVSWCPRNPGLISTTAFDGHVTISTLMGGSQQIIQQQNSQISDAFGIQQDSFQQPQSPSAVIIEPLKKPPKWMRKPCGAKFTFGGKLISFGNYKEPGVPKQVHISQVVTEIDFVKKSHELENALLAGHFTEFCDMKISLETDPKEQMLWSFLKGNFHSEPRLQFLDLLGYDPQELSEKISGLIGGRQSAMNDSLGVNATELAMKMEKLKTGEIAGREQEFLGSGTVSPFSEQKTPTTSADDGSALFDAIAAGSVSQENIDEEKVDEKVEPYSIPTKDDTDGLICQALLTGNFEAAVDVCFNDNRMADGLLLAIAGGPDLFARTQKQYLMQAQSAVSKVISSVVNRDWRNIVQHVVIENWKESLSMLVTYSKAEEFCELCCILGERLEKELKDYTSAILCYICAGNVERMVSCWSKSVAGMQSTPGALQKLVEKVMILKKSVETERCQNVVDGAHMSAQICNYAKLLSSQGNLETAMVYLSTVNEARVNILKDRVYRAHGNLQMQAPECPFQRIEVRPQQFNRQPQQKTNSIYPSPSPSPTQKTSPFTPVSAPSSTYYNPGSMYNPNQNNMNHSNMYQTNVTQPMYSPPPQPQVPMVNSNDSFQRPPPPGQYTQGNIPGMYSPQYNQPPQTDPSPRLFNPVANMGYNNPPASMQPPPVPNVVQPTSSTHDLPPPPPSTATHPMTMRAVKESSPTMPPQPEPMNLYNPVMHDYQHGNPSYMMNPVGMTPPSNVGMAPPNNVGMVPPRTNIPGHAPSSGQPPKKEPEQIKPIEKGPIPTEHLVLQQTFDSVLGKCRNASNNPQTKRKIEDVRRKLEILYDLLRGNKVSVSVLNGLHQMAQACQQMDYRVGIQIHTHMITTGNFSEISSFMPGLKTLMQISGQLKV